MERMRKLTRDERALLERQGCMAESWETVEVADEFDTSRVRGTQFSGSVLIGDNRGFLFVDGKKCPCGIYHASLSDCCVGRNVLISRTGSFIHNYVIEENVLIEDVSIFQAQEDARFGNGEKIRVMNETGGRQVTLFDDLNAQVAYMQVLYRHDMDFQEKLEALLLKKVEKRASKKGRIGQGAVIRCCGIIRNVYIGPATIVQGALELDNGTILSCSEHPTVIGSGVILRNFILSEGACIDGGAFMDRVFVGQGVQAGKQVSAENSLFFANSEAFNSEICSVFAGPYMVTHHKSTLLIAGLWSFFNAGSGTNQSNHMYKLGPVHQGVFERGCKSGSFSYHIMECHVSPFTVIIGKHMANVNISPFPFSILTELHSKSNLLPGLNLYSIGTYRDGIKWPARDRRKCRKKRDLIIFDVFSPYTVERMRKGRVILQELLEKAPRKGSFVHYGGVQIKRLLLKKSIHLYTLAIDRYLIGKVLDAIEREAPSATTWSEVTRIFRNSEGKIGPAAWLDLAGLIASAERVEKIVREVRTGTIDTVKSLISRFDEVYVAYEEDERAYVKAALKEEYGISPASMTVDELFRLGELWKTSAFSLNALTLESVKGEFSEAARISYGLDQDEERRQRDFSAVRGSFGENPVTQAVIEEGERIGKRIEGLKALIGRLI